MLLVSTSTVEQTIRRPTEQLSQTAETHLAMEPLHRKVRVLTIFCCVSVLCALCSLFALAADRRAKNDHIVGESLELKTNDGVVYCKVEIQKEGPRFQLFDDKGIRRLVGSAEPTRTWFGVFNSKGDEQIDFAIDQEKFASIRLYDEQKRQWIGLHTGKEEAFVTMFDGKENIVTQLYSSPNDAAVTLLNNKQTSRIDLGVDEKYSTLVLSDPEGRGRMSLGVSNDECVMIVRDKNKQNQSVLQCDTKGTKLMNFDPQNRVRLMMGIHESEPVLNFFDIKGNPQPIKPAAGK